MSTFNPHFPFTSIYQEKGNGFLSFIDLKQNEKHYFSVIIINVNFKVILSFQV